MLSNDLLSLYLEEQDFFITGLG